MKNRNGISWVIALSTTLVFAVSIVPMSRVVAASDIHIDETTFPDQNFRTFVSESFDDDGNGYLSSVERNSVTQVSCFDMGITDLTGIDNFPNLCVLYCGGNQITTLDLSNCHSLYIVSCLENDISILNLSNTEAGLHFEECTLSQTEGCNVYDGSNCRVITDYGVRIIVNGKEYQDDAPRGIVNMYRLYNPNSGEHFYTSNQSERDMLIGVGWSYEGIGWTAPSSSNTPVYRLYNQFGGEHHYTTDVSERNYLISIGWNDEGIGWYSDDDHTVPLYRQYNPNAYANNHNYTTDVSENNWLVSIGWRAEGIGWYGL